MWYIYTVMHKGIMCLCVILEKDLQKLADLLIIICIL